jgi:hypothetical protein
MASTESVDPVADADRRVERAKASLRSRFALLEHRLGEVREQIDVAAHIRLPRPLRAPTSFESELVYTLSDLSTRPSSLAQVLTAYYAA